MEVSSGGLENLETVLGHEQHLEFPRGKPVHVYGRRVLQVLSKLCIVDLTEALVEAVAAFSFIAFGSSMA